MTNLETILHAVLEPRHGQPYTSNKVAEIRDMKSAQVLEWATTHLDPQNRAAFSAVLRRAFDAMRHPKTLSAP